MSIDIDIRERSSRAAMTRREMIQATAAAAIGASLIGGVQPARAEDVKPAAAAPGRKRTIRIAHLTDMHVQPERHAGEGYAACLHHVHAQKDKPDVIFSGGDTVMDSFEQTKERTATQWTLFKKVVKEECRIPIEFCIGNHDVWGWHKEKSKTNGTEPGYGKKWAMDEFGIKERFRSFDRAGWHFIVLDSIFPNGNSYKGRLDDAQFEWLAGDLAGVKKTTHVCILSHIPILSASVFLDGNNEKSGNWAVPGGLMHIDARKLKDLFLKHPSVKLCLSGHLHLIDRVDYNGVTYLCNGAVSGNWWKGRHQECDEGYALLNLYDDGSFEHEYVKYGWQAKE